MTDPDDVTPEEIDWGRLRQAVMNLAEIVWTYYQALLATGFSEQNAMVLALSWQTEWMRQTSE